MIYFFSIFSVFFVVGITPKLYIPTRLLFVYVEIFDICAAVSETIERKQGKPEIDIDIEKVELTGMFFVC